MLRSPFCLKVSFLKEETTGACSHIICCTQGLVIFTTYLFNKQWNCAWILSPIFHAASSAPSSSIHCREWQKLESLSNRVTFFRLEGLLKVTFSFELGLLRRPSRVSQVTTYPDFVLFVLCKASNHSILGDFHKVDFWWGFLFFLFFLLFLWQAKTKSTLALVRP